MFGRELWERELDGAHKTFLKGKGNYTTSSLMNSLRTGYLPSASFSGVPVAMVSCTRQGGNAILRRSRRFNRRYSKLSSSTIVMPMTVRLSLLLLIIITLGVQNAAEVSLQFDKVPDTITNQPSAAFTYVCTPLDDDGEVCENVQYSLDSGSWRHASISDSSVVVDGLSDGLHVLQLKYVYGGMESLAEDSAAMPKYQWTVDTIAPNTIIDSGPSQEGEAPRPEETDPFLFFTFHCSEDSCSYRYQFDNLIELTANWDAVVANGLEGHVAVAQVSEDLGENKAKLQINVFLTVSSSYSDPDDPQPMPATVSIRRNAHGTSSGSEDSVSSSAVGSSSTGNETVGGVSGGGSGALVELTLGAPEVDSSTGDTVFSLSAEEEVPGHLELNSSLYVEVLTNSSVLLVSAGLEESITTKEWLRWPYASELPGSHTVAIAAVDEAGNVDPMPAVWKWSVDARPRTSLDSAPQAETASDTAFFAFSCALPGGDAEATAAEQGTPSDTLHGVDLNNNSDNDDGSNTSSSSSSKGGNASIKGQGAQGEGDGGWEIQEGGECTYFYSLDERNFTAVEKLPVSSSSTEGGVSTSSEASSSTSGEGEAAARSSSRALLLTGLADGEHVLKVYACKTNSTECDPDPLTHSWITDTSAPVTSIVSFPDSLTPSQFNFSSSKPLSRFMCKVDPGRWRDCTDQSEFPLPDGLYMLSVIAVDPAGRSDPTPVNYSWEVSMLETTVEYCPPTRIPVNAEAHRVLLGASYDGVPCATGMDCRIEYSIEWTSPTPAVPAPSSSGGETEECAAPPTAAPSPMPSPSQSDTPRPDGSSGHAAGTPSPSVVSNGGGSGNGEIVGTVPGEQANYLSQTVVRCAEEWANCSALEATTSFGGSVDGDGCTKLETVVGQLWHSHGTLILQDLLPGEYNLTFQAWNGFGGFDRSPVMCLFSVLEEVETVNQTQIILMRKPAKIMDNPDQLPALFEFALEGSTTTPAAAVASSSSSLDPRLSYLLSGPETAGDGGAASSDEWQAVPVFERDDLVGDSGSSSNSVSSGGDLVWGLKLEELDDGAYRLQVRDNLLGDTAEYSWNVDMAVPELTLDISPQDPSHSTESKIFLRCSKLSCGLEYEVNENGGWYLLDPSSIDTESGTGGGAGAMGFSRDVHHSGAPTPTPANGRRLQATSSGGWGTGGVQGNANDDHDDDGTEDKVTVSVFSHQVSDHELAFLIRVNVPDSGNYTLAIRPADVYSAASSYYNDGRTLMVEWEVDLNRPETIVLSGPDAVTTEGSAMFEFGCELGGDEPEDGCYYEFQMTAVGSLEDKVDVDWDSVDWLPTDNPVDFYEIPEGVNILRVRAQDSSTELYDLVPAEVIWIRDATAPQLEWRWTPEETSHLSDALFEFTCSGELPLYEQPLVFVEGGQHFWPQEHHAQDNQQLQQTRNTMSSSSHSSWASSMMSSSSGGGGGSSASVSSSSRYSARAISHDRSADASAALSVAYPSADPYVLPSGCAFEGGLDGADFERIPNVVTLRGLSNGDHSFSVTANDLAGNVAPTVHYNWTVNTDVPETIIIASPAPTASSTSANFRIMDTVDAANGKGVFEYRLDGKPDNASWFSTSNTTLTFVGLEDGVHTLTVRATEGEESGGSSDQVPEVVTWTVDTTCPDTTFVVLPDVVTHLTSDVLVVKGDPDAVSFEYSLSRPALGEDGDDDDGGSGGGSSGDDDDGGGTDNEAVGSQTGGDDSTGSSSAGGGEESVESDWLIGDSSGVIHLHHLQEGRHKIRVRAVDSAGNVDPSPAIYSWIVDRAGLYGHPSMVTDVVAEGGNKNAIVSWAPPADDGGGALTKYIVVASTAYTDISVEAIATVSPETDGDEPPTETTFTGLTNGLVYSFQVVAVNAFGHSPRSLPSDKVMTYDPADPCGLVTCGDHGSCFVQRSESNALRGYCVCRPGYSGEDCSVAETAGDESAVVHGAYPGSWGECDTKCGGGMRYRSVQCVQYVTGIPMTSLSSNSSCWEGENVEDIPSRAEMTQGSCRHVACLAMFLDVTMRLRAFYDDACFTVAAQDAFLSGFAAEVAHALNINWELVIDLNVLRTNKHNEMEVQFIIAPGTGADQPVENLRQQLKLQGDSETSRLRTHGTWARKLIPDSLEVSQGTYELPPLSVKGIASDLVMILMSVGTTCLVVAVYGACTSRKSKKWDSVYDEEYRQDGPPPSSSSGRSITSQEQHGDAESEGRSRAGATTRRSGWFQLDDDSEDSYSDWDEEDEEDEEDETSPFFGRCALRLLCRPEERAKDSASSSGDGEGTNGASSPGSGCGEGGFGSRFCRRGGGGSGGVGDGGDDEIGVELRTITPAASTTGPSGLESVVPIPLTGKNRPPPPLPGDVNLHRRRGWGVGGGSGAGQGSSIRDVEEGSRGVSRGARVGGGSAVDAGLEIQRPGRQAML